MFFKCSSLSFLTEKDVAMRSTEKADTITVLKKKIKQIKPSWEGSGGRYSNPKVAEKQISVESTDQLHVSSGRKCV